MGIWATIAGFFSSSGVIDAGLRIAERRLTSDATDKERIDFVLKYAEITKGQSPARRIIAFALVFFWLLLGLVWMVSAGLGQFTDIEGAVSYSGLIMVFMKENLKDPLNIIVSFYFVMNFMKK